jgi:hypothetical protein
MVKIARQEGQKCTLNKPLYCPKNGEHLTPSEWDNEKGVLYLSLEKQGRYFPELSKLIPLRHYSRKNFGYLLAILNDAQYK